MARYESGAGAPSPPATQLTCLCLRESPRFEEGFNLFLIYLKELTIFVIKLASLSSLQPEYKGGRFLGLILGRDVD